MKLDDSDHWVERDRTLPRQPGEIPETDPEEFFKAGLFLLKRDKAREALVAFRRALAAKETDPRYMSYTGLAVALAEGKTKEAVKLCEKAVEREFYRADLFLNLGRAYLLAGLRRRAHLAFRKGLSLDRDHKYIRQELEMMGVRKQPVFPFLDRGHPLNKYTGKVLYKLRLR